MKTIALLSLMLVLQFIGLSTASAQLQFLKCDLKDIEKYKQRCQVWTSCEIMDQVRAGLSSRDDLLSNKCFRKKAMACYCLTFEGGRVFDGNDFKFEDVAIYGNFCGWRNAAKALDGSSLDWGNETLVSKSENALQPIDPLDAICKAHDHDYSAQPNKICSADRKAIKAMQSLAFDLTHDLPDSVREQALAMAESLIRNRVTCHLMDLFN